LPEDACWGLTQHSVAKDASLRSRSRLLPAAMSRVAAGQHRGGVAGDRVGEQLFEVVNFVG
jgi:hypothetical protein